jgi:diacylglycerol kinase family enzyme
MIPRRARGTACAPVDTMRVVVLMNPSAGAKARGRPASTEIDRALRDAGAEPTIQLVPPGRLLDAARERAATRPDALVAAGGDGTIGAVAAALVGHPTPLGILPLGTLNHFAKDLRIPLDLAGAARVIAGGHARAVDVADVNGRAFINNASIGLYPQLVATRDLVQRRFGIGKWGAMFFAGLSVFRRHPNLRVRIAPDGEPDDAPLTTPFVFVGNNPYEIRLLAAVGRSHLDRGELCLYVVTGGGRLRLVRLALAALTGTLDQARDFRSMCPRECWIESARRELRVALDGEVTRLTPPLHFRSRPGALRVLAPPPSPPDAPQAPKDETPLP